MLRYCLFTGQLQQSHGKRINFLKCVVYLYLDTELREIGTFKCEFLQKKKKEKKETNGIRSFNREQTKILSGQTWTNRGQKNTVRLLSKFVSESGNFA